VVIKDVEGNEQMIYQYTGEKSRFSCTWIDETAETIAEIMQIPIEDNTGIESVIRQPGETDIPLIDFIKQHGSDTGKSAPSIPHELQNRLNIERTETGFEIYSTHMPLSLFSLVKALFALVLVGFSLTVNLIILYGLDEIVVLFQEKFGSENGDPIIMALFSLAIFLALLTIYAVFNYLTLYLGLFLFTRLKRTTIVGINSYPDKKEISLSEKGLLLTRVKGTISLKAVEKLIIVQKWSEKHTVEFVGDEQRLQLPGDYSIEEVKLLEELFRDILVLIDY